jgi:hypothetical protein
MRRFHSYGPVDAEEHFSVPRTELVERCVSQLVGAAEKGGHYFTIWAPRQTGKTWIMRRARDEIRKRYGDRFLVGNMSMQGVVLEDDDLPKAFLEWVPQQVRAAFDVSLEPPPTWRAFHDLFRHPGGLSDRPLILFVDEFDSLPRPLIDRLVGLFRDMYLHPENCLLHGLALIGVRAVLGVESQRGSPFNIQRSLHVPNLTATEVEELFTQYQEESGQPVADEVVSEVFRATRGQPGLVGWFGELLTETYNPGGNRALDRDVWVDVYRSALSREWNNTVLNLVKKARGEYQPHVLELFARSDLQFRLDAEWCSYLYLNGIIDVETVEGANGIKEEVCRFSSPFVQERLYNALTYDLTGDRLPLLAVEPLDTLADVFAGDSLDLAALLGRYTAYLARLADKGIDPWKEQPRRRDLRLTEAVGHFHLYAWLKEALNGYGVVSPEFPTGNGHVDLLIRAEGRSGIVEVKSFTNQRELAESHRQAARYARSLGLDRVTLALFVPTQDDEVLAKLSGTTTVEGTAVTVVAIGWAPP